MKKQIFLSLICAVFVSIQTGPVKAFTTIDQYARFTAGAVIGHTAAGLFKKNFLGPIAGVFIGTMLASLFHGPGLALSKYSENIVINNYYKAAAITIPVLICAYNGFQNKEVRCIKSGRLLHTYSTAERLRNACYDAALGSIIPTLCGLAAMNYTSFSYETSIAIATGPLVMGTLCNLITAFMLLGS